METLIVIFILIIIALVALCLKINKESKPAPKELIVIEVCKRSGDWTLAGDPRYHAQIKGSKAWAAGDTFYEAIGDLVNHNEETGIVVKYLNDISR
jgi:hypothetical protein